MACGPNVDQARSLAGAAALCVADLGWQGDPRRLPPTSEPRAGDRLVRGALAGSGPGTSPYIDGLSLVTGWWYPSTLRVQTTRTMVGAWTTWTTRPISRGVPKLVRGRWGVGFEAPPPYSISRALGRKGASSCDLYLPVVTARVQPEPVAPNAVRTQHGPVPLRGWLRSVGRGRILALGPPRPWIDRSAATAGSIRAPARWICSCGSCRGTTCSPPQAKRGPVPRAPSGYGRCYWTVILPCIHGWMTHR
jgi:hypothetical protein